MFKKIKTWFDGKKRRIAIIAMTIATVDPEPYSRAGLVIVGVLLGGADLIELAAKTIKANKEK
jgi:hypothetical protein